MNKPSINFGSFIQRKQTFLTPDDGIDCENTPSVAFNGETLYITQPNCTLIYSNGKIKKSADVFSSFFTVNGEVYAAADKQFYKLTDEKFKSIAEFSSNVTHISTGRDGSFWLTTEDGLYLKKDNDFELICDLPDNLTCLAVLDNKMKYNETVYTGTMGTGLMAMKGKRRHWAEIMKGVTGILSNNVTCIEFDALGYLWVGTDMGMNVYDGKSHWHSGNNIYSLPIGTFNDMYFAENGKKYFATTTGVIILSEGKLTYLSYGAWLKHPNVKTLTVSENGTIAAVTERGISVITEKEMTLSEKAAHYDNMAEKYFVRKDGFCVPGRLKKQGDIESCVLYNSDNDGLWTGVYCASQCFRYAATKDETALFNARRAVNAMIKLTEITNKKGFTARAIRYSDEENFGTGVRDEWHICESDHTCEWLGETSSDEMTGHYFAYSVYYDLCANEEEKKKIAQVVASITNHIIENNFHLTDIDGIPTTWANWDPKFLNEDDKWFYERGTNSLEILSFIKTSYHVTGDDKYEKVFDMLVSDHHYGMNLMQYKVEDAHVAHIDDNLDFINIYPLIKYTEDNAQKEIFKMGLTHHFLYERVERSPMFNIMYGILTENNCDIEKAAISLSEMNLDLIKWPVYNSYRKDIVWDDEQESIGLSKQLKEPLEYSARVFSHYDTNQFVCDSGCDEFTKDSENDKKRLCILPGTKGADGKSMISPYVYLLPYWMGRYYGLIAD